MSDLEYLRTMLDTYGYNTKTNTAWYHLPTTGDVPPNKFIKFIKYVDTPKSKYKDVLLDRLIEVAKVEYDRIKIVRGRQSIDSKFKIKNFDENGDKFIQFDFLNKHLDEIDSLAKDGNVDGLNALLGNAIITYMNEAFQEFKEVAESLGLYTKEAGNEYYVNAPQYKTEEGLNKFLEEYFWNSTYATTQIISIFTTDLAYYKLGIEDFQKRNKQIIAPSVKLDFRDDNGVEMNQGVLYVNDLMESSSQDLIEFLTDVFKERVAEKTMTPIEMSVILNKFRGKEINVTDAQALRSLRSWRKINMAAGNWSDEIEEAYQAIKNGNWEAKHFDTI
jgi:hypothetical protein